jgi:hypothetical protein
MQPDCRSTDWETDVPDPDESPQPSRWAVSPLEAMLFAALAVLAALAAVLDFRFIIEFAPGPVHPQPAWPVLVLFGVGAFLVKHRRPRPRNEPDDSEERPPDPFFDRE